MRSRQVRLVILEVSAVILGTLATFMPMKAILILASGSVPGFYPATLVAAGPLWTATALLAVSAAFGLATRLASTLATHGRVSVAIGTHHAASLVSRDMERVSRAKRVRDSIATEWVIVIVFGALLAWLSPLFLLLTTVWLWSAVVLVKRSVRSETGERHPVSGAFGFRHRYLKLVRSSILPSSIVISLLVLLSTHPRLGVTGALLSVVVGRRFQLAGAAVLVRWIGDSTTVNNDGQQGQRPGGVHGTGVPSAVTLRLAPSRDGRALDQYLRSRGRQLDECGLIGTGMGQQGIALVPYDGDASTSTYWRVFNRESWHVRDLEFAFRTSEAPISLFSGESVTSVDIGGLCLLEVTCASPFWVGKSVSRDSFREWRRSVVAACTGSDSFQSWAEGREVGFPERELADLLTLAVSVPGLHRARLEDVQTVIEDVNERLRQRPFCWTPQGASRTSGLLLGIDGRLIVASPQGWGIGRVGDLPGSLVDSDEDEVTRERQADETDPHGLSRLALGRSELLRDLRRSNFMAAAQSADRLRGLASGAVHPRSDGL